MKNKAKHPLIREIQLGKSVEDVIGEHLSDIGLEGWGSEEKLPEIIKEIIRINKNDLRFAVLMDDRSCEIIVLNDDGKSELSLNYWDYDDGALEDHAYGDCEKLNRVVERIYGTKRKRLKAKIPLSKFLEKNGGICPYCGRKPLILDSSSWNDRNLMGCPGCGETWTTHYKMVATGFKR